MEPYVGEIRLFSGNFAPVGWLTCDGSLISIAANEVLYTLLGTTYGGDGQTTFGLPDLRGRLAVNQGQGLGRSNYLLGQLGGTESVTLTTGNMAAHSHSFTVCAAPATQTTIGNNYLAQPVDQTTNNKYITRWLPASVSGATSQSFLPATVSAAGGSQPHENRQPFVVGSYIIATVGLFPSSN